MLSRTNLLIPLISRVPFIQTICLDPLPKQLDPSTSQKQTPLPQHSYSTVHLSLLVFASSPLPPSPFLIPNHPHSPPRPSPYQNPPRANIRKMYSTHSKESNPKHNTSVIWVHNTIHHRARVPLLLLLARTAHAGDAAVGGGFGGHSISFLLALVVGVWCLERFFWVVSCKVLCLWGRCLQIEREDV